MRGLLWHAHTPALSVLLDIRRATFDKNDMLTRQSPTQRPQPAARTPCRYAAQH